MFLFQSPSIFPLNQKYGCPLIFHSATLQGAAGGLLVKTKKRESELIPLIFVTPTGFKPVTF